MHDGAEILLQVGGSPITVTELDLVEAESPEDLEPSSAVTLIVVAN